MRQQYVDAAFQLRGQAGQDILELDGTAPAFARDDLLSRQVLHADETPWPCSNRVSARRSVLPLELLHHGLGQHQRGRLRLLQEPSARRILGIGEDGVGGWRGTLICDDYGGYKQAMNAE